MLKFIFVAAPTTKAATTTIAATSTTAAPTTTTGAGGFKQLTDKIDTSLTYCSETDNGVTSGRIIDGTIVDKNSWPALVRVATFEVIFLYTLI